jgi:ribosomal protein L28
MRHCEVCGKKSIMVGHRIKLRGKYNPTGMKRKYPNLQKTVTPDGNKVIACAECIKGSSKKALRTK